MFKTASSHLKKERKLWRKNHPFKFFAAPIKNEDGTANYLIWTCKIPGQTGTFWEDGYYTLRLFFSPEYPKVAPRCVFDPPIFHPNIYPSGLVSLATFDQNKEWAKRITVKKILSGIQRLLTHPNEHDPVCPEAVRLYCYNRLEYDQRIEKQARAMRPNEVRCECCLYF